MRRQHLAGADGFVLHAAQRQRNQCDDDYRIEDDGGEHRALRRMQPHDVQFVQLGIYRGKHRRNDREIFRDVIGNRKCGQRAASNQQLLSDGHDLDQLGRIAVEIHHVAGFFCRHGSRVHGHAHIGLSQRRRVIGSVTGHGHEASLRLFFADVFQLVFRRGLRKKVIHAGFLRDGSGGQGIVSGDHHRANSHGAQRSKPFFHSTLYDVFEMNDAENS